MLAKNSEKDTSQIKLYPTTFRSFFNASVWFAEEQHSWLLHSISRVKQYITFSPIFIIRSPQSIPLWKLFTTRIIMTDHCLGEKRLKRNWLLLKVSQTLVNHSNSDSNVCWFAKSWQLDFVASKCNYHVLTHKLKKFKLERKPISCF